MLDPVFGQSDSFLRTASPRTTDYVRRMVAALEPPKSLAERNLAQLTIAKRVASVFELDIVHAVEAVSPIYAARFPKPLPKPRVVRRIGRCSIDVTDFPH